MYLHRRRRFIAICVANGEIGFLVSFFFSTLLIAIGETFT